MKAARFLGWVMLIVWASLGLALQLAWAHRLAPFGGPLEFWLPDGTLILLVALGVRLPKEQIWKAAFCLAVVRIAFTNDAPVVVLAAYAWVALGLHTLRSAVDVSGIFPRMLVTLLAAAWVPLFCEVVHVLRTPMSLGPRMAIGDLAEIARGALPTALVSCALVGLLGSVLANLPGLSPLYKRPRF